MSQKKQIQPSSSSQIQNSNLVEEAKELLLINCLDDEICWRCKNIIQLNICSETKEEKINAFMYELQDEGKIFQYNIDCHFDGITIRYIDKLKNYEVKLLDFTFI